jgi:sugar-specific transcriptional regulator TrmB
MTNMTYAQAIDNAIALFSQGGQVDAEDRETVEKLEALKAQLAKRGSGKKGQTKTQKENEGIKAVIAEVLNESGEKKTVTELISDERLNGYTNQKISALLRQMVEAGCVNKSIEGKKAYFEAVPAEE